MARAEDSDGIIHFLWVALVVSEHREVKIYSYVVEIHSDPHKKPEVAIEIVIAACECRSFIIVYLWRMGGEGEWWGGREEEREDGRDGEEERGRGSKIGREATGGDLRA